MPNFDSTISLGLELGEAALDKLNKVINLRAESPGFFVPFRSVSGVVCTLTAAVWNPILLGAVSLVAGIAAVVSAVASAAGFLFTLPAFCFGKDLGLAACAFGLVGAGSCAISALLSFLAVGSAVVNIPVGVVKVFTRTGATVADLLGCYEPGSVDEEVYSCCGVV